MDSFIEKLVGKAGTPSRRYFVSRRFYTYLHLTQALWLRQVESYLKDTGMAGLASAWAMARRRPKEYRRKVDAATRCSGVCPHTWPDLVVKQCSLVTQCQVRTFTNCSLSLNYYGVIWQFWCRFQRLRRSINQGGNPQMMAQSDRALASFLLIRRNMYGLPTSAIVWLTFS